MKAHDIYSPVYRVDTPKAYPVIIRKTLTGQGGYGIVVCPDAETFAANWDDAYVWTPFIKTQFELRVHVLGGQVAKIFKKECVDAEEGDLPIRNLDAGYHFAVKDAAIYPKVQALVDKVQAVLKGRFYTLDIGWDKETKQYFIFEANSGSGLNPQTAALYADYLVRELYATDTL
jgi:glutathione synthase/RimK-type ligase-like ATP-grasp enzyme